MQAWPIEEAFLVRPLGSLALAAMLPLAADALLSRIAGRDPEILARARAPVRGTLLAIAWLIGATALGPSWAEAPGGVVSHAAATLCVAAALFVDRLRIGGGDWRALVAGYAAAMLISGALATVTPHAIFVGAVIIGIAGGLAYRPKGASRGESAVGFWLGGALAAMLVGLLALPIPLTHIRLEEAPRAGDSTWRLRIDPWDANAMLANGWAARRRGDLGRATASAREAIRMGLDEGPALELEAEVLAARGRCAEAQATFDRAIRVRATDAFDEGSLLAPLVLGGYQLPPTLVTECGGLEVLPGLEDLRNR